MRQSRQNLPLTQKSDEYRLAVHAALDELEGDELLELPVDAFRQHHHAHTAAPQFALYSPTADVRAGGRRLAVACPIRGHGNAQLWNVLIERTAGGVGLQQRDHVTAQLDVVAATLLQQCSPFGRRDLAELIEHAADAPPALGIHV